MSARYRRPRQGASRRRWKPQKKADHPGCPVTAPAGRAGMTLLQAVLDKGSRTCLVPAVPSGLCRASDTLGSDMPWERALADAVHFILDHTHNDNDAAATINFPSLGGVTAMDIACDALAYWRRAGPWTDLAHFGAPGPAPLKPFARACAVVLHRAVVALAARGARCAHPGRDLLARVRELDVAAVRDELRRAEGGAAALGATNFRGLAAMALALDVVVCAQDPLEELTDLCGAAAEDAFGLDDDVFLQIDAAAAARSPAAAADIVGLLLDAGADPAGLVQLFRDDGDGWWQRPATSMGGGNGSWSAYHLDRLLWNIEAVFSRVDEARRRRCLESHELARAVAMRASDAGFEVVDEDEFCEKVWRPWCKAIGRTGGESPGSLLVALNRKL
ncbi:hypothetical protein DFJ73DRAFT_910532 [Zopfochytrium polystomum]|nr:hypothetical protein DFJ73DRAFT_910532 [Zopfochytrium polystomum]